ncbi:MAG: retroviral-like aspartic protease, partial [Gammaproteobacteria bacterium]|nr:retroviral-like aspartic protease [Gammaproteobacteria bacterium]
GGGDLIPQVQPSEREQEYVSDMEFLNGEGQLTPSAVVNQLQLMSPYPVQTEEGEAIGWDLLEKADDAQGGELLELAERLSTKRGCRLRAEYAGLYDQDPSLGDDPANAEINYFEEVAPRVPRKLETLPFLTDIPDEYLPWARPEDLPVIFGMLDGEPVDMMFDSGANMDIISESVYNRIARGNDSTLELVNEKEVELHSVGRKVPTLGKCKGTITYGRMTSFETVFCIVSDAPHDVIISGATMKKQNIWLEPCLTKVSNINETIDTLTPGQIKRIRKSLSERDYVTWQVYTKEDTFVGPYEEHQIPIYVRHAKDLGLVMFEPHDNILKGYGLLLSRAVQNIDNGWTKVIAMNFSKTPVHIPKGTRLGF